MITHDDQDFPYMGASKRRRLLIRGPQSLAALAAGGLVGGRIAEAAPVTSPRDIQPVDRLRITVVTDSYHHAFESPLVREGLTVERTGFVVAPGVAPTKTLQNEWGLSLHVESMQSTERRRVLLDFGYTPHTLLNNLELLRLDPALIDALALSHGHVDHFGGLAGFLAKFQGKLRDGLPLFVGGEECFCERELVLPGSVGNFGAIDRQSIREAGLTVTFADGPSVIAEHGFTTGRIELRSFERVLVPTRMHADTDPAPCGAAGVSDASTVAVPDDFVHEIALAYLVRGRGLVVMTSCGHRGVVNSVQAAIDASGVSQVLAVIGGFHLAPHPPEYQEATAKALVAIGARFIVPMHCSGERFIRLLEEEAATAFIRSSTGTTFDFAA